MMRLVHRFSVSLGRRDVLSLLFVAILAISTPGMALAEGGVRYGGIEVGAKGIKAIVLEVGTAGPPTTLMTGIANTTLSQGVDKTKVFADSAIADTADEVEKFAARILGEFKVPASNVVVFGSSGLPKVENRDALVKAVAEATKLAPMSFITAADEVKYSIKGQLDTEADRASALLVDVGSGNTKGGFLSGDGVTQFSVPFGSVTFENKITTEATTTGAPFPEVAKSLRTSLIEPEIAKQVAAAPAMKDRKIIVLGGGAAYAMATLLRPEDLKKPSIDLTAKDIEDYAALVAKDPITSPALASVGANPEADKEVKSVFDKFTPKNLVAGSELLTALSTTLDFKDKTIRFDRSAIMALSRGRVLEMVSTVAAATPVKPVPEVVPQVTPVVTEVVPSVKPVATEPVKPTTPPVPKKTLPEASGPVTKG